MKILTLKNKYLIQNLGRKDFNILVVTIVVLLILAAVSISMVGGENGIIKQAEDTKIMTRASSVEDEVTK